MKKTYFCNYCFKTDYEGNKCFFSCEQKQDYIRHLKRKSHLKREKENETGNNLCVYCNKTFNDDEYKNHLEVNKEFFNNVSVCKIVYKMKCNHFIDKKGKRHSDAMSVREKEEKDQLDAERRKVAREKRRQKAIEIYQDCEFLPEEEEKEPYPIDICMDPHCHLNKYEEPISVLKKFNITSYCKCDN